MITDEVLWQVLRRSAMGRAARLLVAAAGSSATARTVRRLRARVHAAPAALLIGVLGLAIMSAGVTTVLLARLLPAGTTGAVPAATPLTAALVALVAALGAPHVARAWNDSRSRRWWRRLTVPDA